MKLTRYENNGRAVLGVMVDGRLYDCVKLYEAAGERVPDVVTRADMRAICAAAGSIVHHLGSFLDNSGTRDNAAVPLESVRLLAPLPDPSKIICIGLNYLDHCEEQNKPAPERPMLFAKFANTIVGPTDDVEIPTNTAELDFEGELAVVIGREARKVSKEQALEHVFGYMVLLDVSARDLQRNDGQWVRAKSQDGFAPCGPWIATADEVGNPQNLAIQTRVNGELMQDSNTGQMIFPVAKLISYVSQALTLLPGDIISTGTPAGVGVHRNPQVLLKDGDVVEVTIGDLGTTRNRFVAAG